MLISGKEIRETFIEEWRKEIQILKNKGITPTIEIIQVGDDPASSVYVRNKQKLCERMEINCIIEHFDASKSEQELLSLINKLNNDKNINGILVQSPLPKHINENKVVQSIAAIKDVDCFNVENVGKLWTARNNFKGIMPCTPAGVIQMLKRSNISISGKNAVVIGRSNITGKPMVALLLLEGATVTVCHSKTRNIAEICSKADILVACAGQAKFITKEYTNPNQVIIDVGINRDENGKLCGDVDFENVKDHVAAISPVPGGAGIMTVTMLFDNLLYVTKIQNEITNS